MLKKVRDLFGMEDAAGGRWAFDEGERKERTKVATRR